MPSNVATSTNGRPCPFPGLLLLPSDEVWERQELKIINKQPANYQVLSGETGSLVPLTVFRLRSLSGGYDAIIISVKLL